MSPLTDQIGRVLAGRYRLVAPIGTGASAHVYAADDSILGRRVAVKVLHPALVSDQAFLRRFRAEAQAAASLNHPHVMRVFDWGEDDDGPFLVLEHLGGGSLRDLLDAGHLLTPAQAALVGSQAAHGLAYAHRRGLVHRDIKPANLLFDEEGSLRVADFGLARALAEAAFTEPIGVVLGTARYASPEQAEGRPVDDKADVYSLALVLFESITGWVPFSADTTVATLMARLGAHLPMVPELGPLGPILGQAAIPEPLARLDAAGLAADLEYGCRGLAPAGPLPLATRAVIDSLADRDPTMLAEVDAARLATRRQEQQARTGEMFLTSGGSFGTSASQAGEALTAGAAGGSPAGLAARAAGAVDRGLSWGRAAPLPLRETGTAPAGDLVTGAGPGQGRRARRAPKPVTAPARAKRSGWWWPVRVGVAAVVVGGLLVAAGAGVASYRRYVVYSHSVPSLKGMSLLAADNNAARDDLLVKVTGRRYDSGMGKGDVIAQSIAPGTHERGGTAIGVLVSEGPAPVAVPNIGGIYYSQAVTKLKAAGLVPFEEPPQYSETVYKDVVTRYSPFGVNELPGTKIDVYVSKGPHPRVIPTSILGEGWSVAEATLKAMRLVPLEETGYSDTVKRGHVISTSPQPGTHTPRGSTVFLEVSLGPEYVRIPPGIYGDSATQARAVLQAEGLYVSEVYGFGSTVFVSQPEAGRTVHVGSAVALYTF